jgi:hypothetical protein
MSNEASVMAEERRKAKEMKAFAEAREKVQSEAREFMTEADGQLSELKRRTVDGFKGL